MTLEHIIGWSKYTLNHRPNVGSGEVQLDGPNIQSVTVQMDDGQMDCPCYVNLDRPNERRSNGPPILCQLGPFKITIVDRYFGTSKNTVLDCCFLTSKITVGNHNFKTLKITTKKY